MGAERPARRLLARVETEVVRSFAGRDRVVLAFSGGLASLVLAAVARKHGDVRGLVVGTAHAADVEAARLARFHLDYPVDIVPPARARVLAMAGTVRGGNPRLEIDEVLALVTLDLVRDRCPRDLVISGFGLAPASARLRRLLAASPVKSPGLSPGRPPPRRLVVEMAEELGLPEPFVLAARRTPMEGSGIGPLVRAAAHERHRSVARLLDEERSPP